MVMGGSMQGPCMEYRWGGGFLGDHFEYMAHNSNCQMSQTLQNISEDQMPLISGYQVPPSGDLILHISNWGLAETMKI